MKKFSRRQFCNPYLQGIDRKSVTELFLILTLAVFYFNGLEQKTLGDSMFTLMVINLALLQSKMQDMGPEENYRFIYSCIKQNEKTQTQA